MGDLVIDSVRTTPEASDLHAIFAVAASAASPRWLWRCPATRWRWPGSAGCASHVGGYTNFGTDHLDFHRDAEDYFAAKALLFDGRCDVEVLNHDDPALRPLYKPATLTYSAAGDAPATWRAADITDDGYAQRFTAYGPDGLVAKAGVALPGRHNVANALLAHREPGTPSASTRRSPRTAWRRALGVPGRLERVDRRRAGHRRGRLRTQARRDSGGAGRAARTAPARIG